MTSLTESGVEVANAPLMGVRVLLTRTSEDNAELRGPLEQLGADVLSLPCIALGPPPDPEAFGAVLGELEDFDWIAFTSRNGVRAVFAVLGTEALPARIKIAAVGPGTQRELDARGERSDLRFHNATAKALGAAMIAGGVEGKRVLLPQADIARRELATMLREAGAKVDEVAAYQTAKPESFDPDVLGAVRDGTCDIALIASPSAINNLIDALGSPLPLRRCRLVAIGESSARAIKAHDLAVAEVAREASPEGLVAAVLEAAKGDPHG